MHKTEEWVEVCLSRIDDESKGSNVVEELHVDLAGKVLGLTHEVLEVLASTVLGGGHVAALVVVLLCSHTEKQQCSGRSEREGEERENGQ